MPPELWDFGMENGIPGFVIVGLAYFIWVASKQHGEEREIWRKDNKERYEKIVDVIKSQQDAFVLVAERLTEHSTLMKELKDTIKNLNDKR